MIYVGCDNDRNPSIFRIDYKHLNQSNNNETKWVLVTFKLSVMVGLSDLGFRHVMVFERLPRVYPQ